MYDVTAQLLAEEIFEDTSSIVAAKATTSEMQDAALKYLDILNQQGVINPPEPDGGNTNNNTLLAVSRDAEVSLHLFNAHQALLKSDLPGYQAHIEVVFSAETERIAATDLKGLQSGVWYEIPVSTHRRPSLTPRTCRRPLLRPYLSLPPSRTASRQLPPSWSPCCARPMRCAQLSRRSTGSTRSHPARPPVSGIPLKTPSMTVPPRNGTRRRPTMPLSVSITLTSGTNKVLRPKRTDRWRA
jgi:hypothetical protein